jgi:hypothetical protein
MVHTGNNFTTTPATRAARHRRLSSARGPAGQTAYSTPPPYTSESSGCSAFASRLHRAASPYFRRAGHDGAVSPAYRSQQQSRVGPGAGRARKRRSARWCARRVSTRPDDGGSRARLLAIASALAAMACYVSGAAFAAGSPKQGRFAGRIDIGGGRELYLSCAGRGSPTVIMDSGIHDSSDPWTLTQTTYPVPASPSGVCGRRAVHARVHL